MAWWFATKKELRKFGSKIKADITELVSQGLNNRVLIEELREQVVSKKEIELMIREGILEVREPTPQTSRTTTRTSPQTNKRKKANKLLDKMEIMAEIASMEETGTATSDIFNEIVTMRGLCRKTCFYKYLKIVRGQAARTPRTKVTN
ncbi:hypothetical protein LCGC14_3072530 [marine sediment metagenome]|uniref:Uncharacterized protein n=1 Tax=marine sediment metagenome TaxID=412755 RepID=A0A0F8YN96_9ZZZZ